jgi:hypothetical protein
VSPSYLHWVGKELMVVIWVWAGINGVSSSCVVLVSIRA